MQWCLPKFLLTETHGGTDHKLCRFQNGVFWKASTSFLYYVIHVCWCTFGTGTHHPDALDGPSDSRVIRKNQV